jgi:hypothetical protein
MAKVLQGGGGWYRRRVVASLLLGVAANACRQQENWNVVDPTNPMATVLAFNASETTLGGCCAACGALPGCKMAALAPPSWAAAAGCYLKTGAGNGSAVAGVTTLHYEAAPGGGGGGGGGTTCSSVVRNWDVNLVDVYAAVLRFLPAVTTVAGCCAACTNESACVMSALAPVWWGPNSGCYLKTGQGTGAARPGVSALFQPGRLPAPFVEPARPWRQTLACTIVLSLAGWAASALVACLLVRELRRHDDDDGVAPGGASDGVGAGGNGKRRGGSLTTGLEMVEPTTVGVPVERRNAAVETAASEVTAQMALYTARRAREKQRKQQAVARVAWAMLAVGNVLYVAETVVDEVLARQTVAGERARVSTGEEHFLKWEAVGRPLLTMVGGIFLVSSDLSTEQLLARRVCNIFYGCTLVEWVLVSQLANGFCFDLYWSNEPLAKVSLAFVPTIAICLFYLLLQRRIHRLAGAAPAPWGLRPADLFIVTMVVATVNDGFFQIRLGITGLGDVAWNELASAAVFFAAVLPQLWVVRTFGRRVQSVWYLWIATNAMRNGYFVFNYFSPCGGKHFGRDVPFFVVLQVVYSALWVTTWQCRHVYFRVVVLMFERRQRIQDGAVVASLLELRSQPAVGDEWFLLDGECRHWYPGRVVEVREGVEFLVAAADDVGSAAAGDAALPPGAPLPALERRQWLPMLPQRTRQELMEHAVRSTRCMPFQSITLELLRSSKGDAGTFALSEPLKPGGRIDWFVSHSWHDDCAAKFEELARLAAEFQRRHKRYPTVWLDKTCIDQSAIADSLKCLPIFLQACDEVVALVGGTYFGRLWCVWEIYARIAFTGASSQHEGGGGGGGKGRPSGVRFFPLRSIGDQQDLVRLIGAFELGAARCFDPNEQSKLLHAIAAADGGSAAFELAVRSFGRLVESGACGGNSSSSSSSSSSPSSPVQRCSSLDSTASGGGGGGSPHWMSRRINNPLTQSGTSADDDDGGSKRRLEEGVNPGIIDHPGTDTF